jgi:hypothetical protein
MARSAARKTKEESVLWIIFQQIWAAFALSLRTAFATLATNDLGNGGQ